MATLARGTANRLQLFTLLNHRIMASRTGCRFFHSFLANRLYDLLGGFIFVNLLERRMVLRALPYVKRRFVALPTLICAHV